MGNGLRLYLRMHTCVMNLEDILQLLLFTLVLIVPEDNEECVR